MENQAGGRPTEGIVSWWQSEDGFFAKVECLLIASLVLFSIKVVFGWWRRCSSCAFIKHSVWVAHTLTPILATYTLGFISSYNLKTLPLSAVFNLNLWSSWLFVALGSTYSMRSYHVDENKEYTRHSIRLALYGVNMVALVRSYSELVGNNSTSAWVVAIITSVALLCWPPGLLVTSASLMASSSSDKESLYLQDYMATEHLKSARYDPVTLEGYNYILFFIPTFEQERVTISQVWASNQGILGSSYGTRLKEICLSYALSILLRRRFFGATCPESKSEKTHDLVFKGLLSHAEENYQAAYRVIETELAFTHDHFFTTTTPYFGNKIMTWGIFLVFIYVGLFIYSILPSLKVYNFSKWTFTTIERKADVHIVTIVILLVVLALHLLQLYIYLSSDAARVQLASLSITPFFKCDCIYQALRVSNKFPQLFGCWQNKIGQHSLLKDLHSRSLITDLSGSLSWFIFDKLLCYPSAFPRGIRNPGIENPDRIPLTCRIKKAIALTLKSSDGHLSNGTSSLERNGQAQLSEEFLLGSHAGDILTWHIATEYCDISRSRRTVTQDDSALSNHHVATSLSSYCAYLMAFVPELLPDHQLETTAVFHRTRGEALKHLRKEKTLEEKYAKLSNYDPPLPQPDENMSDSQSSAEGGSINDVQPPPQHVNVFYKGVLLGKRLEGITNDGRRWKILADFWTEMIMYIAPSNNARDHIQHLANGGEFLTHLWALLTHAGILERDHTEDTQNPVNHHQMEEEEEEADREGEAHVHGNGGFSSLPAQRNYDSIASSSANNQMRVQIV